METSKLFFFFNFVVVNFTHLILRALLDIKKRASPCEVKLPLLACQLCQPVIGIIDQQTGW